MRETTAMWIQGRETDGERERTRGEERRRRVEHVEYLEEEILCFFLHFFFSSSSSSWSLTPPGTPLALHTKRHHLTYLLKDDNPALISIVRRLSGIFL